MLPRIVVRGRKNPLYLGFADRLRRGRRTAGWSLAVLARAASSTGQTILDLERGERCPRVDTAERLARSLDLSPSLLAFGIDLPWEPTAPLLCCGLGARLREVRIARGLSLREVGRRAETSGNLVTMVESGTSPALDTVEKLAQAIEVSPAWLAFGLGPMEAPARQRLGPQDQTATSAGE